MQLSDSQRAALFKKLHTELLAKMMLAFDEDPQRVSIIRSLAMGCPDLIEDLRVQLMEYTSIPGVVAWACEFVVWMCVTVQFAATICFRYCLQHQQG